MGGRGGEEEDVISDASSRQVACHISLSLGCRTLVFVTWCLAPVPIWVLLQLRGAKTRYRANPRISEVGTMVDHFLTRRQASHVRRLSSKKTFMDPLVSSLISLSLHFPCSPMLPCEPCPCSPLLRPARDSSPSLCFRLRSLWFLSIRTPFPEQPPRPNLFLGFGVSIFTARTLQSHVLHPQPLGNPNAMRRWPRRLSEHSPRDG